MNKLITNKQLNKDSLLIHKSLENSILSIDITDQELSFKFQDNSRLIFFDDGQSCCESRYIHTDDDLKYYIGANFLGYEIKPGPSEDNDGYVKECEFFVIHTSKGEFTLVNYNVHNGYYSGFSLKVKEGI